MTASPEPSRRRFPILRFLAAAVRNWRTRHQNPLNFALHMPGIPLAYLGLLQMLLAAADLSGSLSWLWGLGAFVGGFVLQWLGHRIEGNDVGEMIPLKRLLGLPTVSVAPQYRSSGPPQPST